MERLSYLGHKFLLMSILTDGNFLLSIIPTSLAPEISRDIGKAFPKLLVILIMEASLDVSFLICSHVMKLTTQITACELVCICGSNKTFYSHLLLLKV